MPCAWRPGRAIGPIGATTTADGGPSLDHSLLAAAAAAGAAPGPAAPAGATARGPWTVAALRELLPLARLRPAVDLAGMPPHLAEAVSFAEFIADHAGGAEVQVLEAYTDGSAKLSDGWPRTPATAGWGSRSLASYPVVSGRSSGSS